MTLELGIGDAYGAGFEYVDRAMVRNHTGHPNDFNSETGKGKIWKRLPHELRQTVNEYD